jgi:hypothetical protein
MLRRERGQSVAKLVVLIHVRVVLSTTAGVLCGEALISENGRLWQAWAL